MVWIREATLADSDTLAALSGQLGYPADTRTIERRLRDIATCGADVVLVAESDPGVVVGWTHLMPERALVFDARAQLAGLIVAVGARGRGVGVALLHAAEEWAHTQGFAKLVVRSNVIRDRAHGFYLREGYEETKRQAVFIKTL